MYKKKKKETKKSNLIKEIKEIKIERLSPEVLLKNPVNVIANKNPVIDANHTNLNTYAVKEVSSGLIKHSEYDMKEKPEGL